MPFLNMDKKPDKPKYWRGDLKTEIVLLLIVKLVLIILLWWFCFSEPVAKDTRQALVTRTLLHQK